jgi:hypothetical protein
MRLAAVRPHRHAQRALRAARQPALGGLAVDQVSAGRGQMVGRARAVGAFLLADDQKELDSLLAT